MDDATVGRWRASVGDRVAVGAAIVLLAVLALGSTSSDARSADRGFDFGAVWLLAVAAGFAALGRRAPATGALANLAITVAWYQIGYSSSLVNVPYLVAFYLLGTTGDRRRQLVVGGAAVLLSGGAILAAADESTVSAASAIGWTVAALLFGEVAHGRRALLRELEARALRAEAERDREAERRVAQARLEMARDLHDVLAHTVSVMTVQAGVGADALQRGSDEVGAALGNIRSAGREAMAEVQALVAVLRNGSEPPGTAPAPRLDRVADLADATRAAGVEVELVLDVPDGLVSEVAELTAFRIVQESLTNVVRHAGAGRATVTARVEGGDLVVEVHDDGTGATGRVDAGFGLRGMRERVESLGGAFAAGGDGTGGWRVRATIPRDRRATP